MADPPVNDRLLDKMFMHAGLVDRLREGMASRIAQFLSTEVYPDVVETVRFELDRLDDLGERGTSESRQAVFQRLLEKNNQIIHEGMTAAAATTKSELLDFTKVEAAWQVRAIQQSLPVLFEVRPPSAKLLNAIVTQQPFEGQKLGEWFRGLDASARKGIATQVQIGMFNGEGISSIVGRVRGTSARGFRDGAITISRRNAEAVVRSAVSHVAGAAREAVYQENADLIKSVMWVATLDGRTCPECMKLDGMSFGLKDGPRPPAHVNCRCDTVPVTKSWKELGIDLEEAPPGTRASMDGQIPEHITYEKWLQNKSSSFQNEVLGPGRASLFRQGLIGVKDLTDNRGRMLTLEELKRIEGLN